MRAESHTVVVLSERKRIARVCPVETQTHREGCCRTSISLSLDQIRVSECGWFCLFEYILDVLYNKYLLVTAPYYHESV